MLLWEIKIKSSNATYTPNFILPFTKLGLKETGKEKGIEFESRELEGVSEGFELSFDGHNGEEEWRADRTVFC